MPHPDAPPPSPDLDDLPVEPTRLPVPPLVWTLLPGVVLAALAWAVSLSGTNEALFLSLNARMNAALPAWIWAGLSLSGAVLGVIALLAPTLKTQPRWMGAALLAAPLGVLFSQGGKHHFDVMRPAGVLDPERFTLIGQKLYVHAFPSGHATTAFLTAAVILLAWPRQGRRWQAGALLLSLAILAALSRVAVGAHWPLDVLAGASGGWLCGAFGVWASTRLRFWEKPGGVRLMAIFAMATSLAMLFIDMGYPEARILQISLGAWGIGGAAAALSQDRR
ncbi:phosphatase PAP2 family protein [Zoogloea sp.]|uniref:phosphatase PAP2 family protein n=1 Tax=Zoogloea sp. TaxID=49181 RepID=UPI00260F1DF5|nr:phosphatase PAP2 family protein [Zoogloea sp.]MDD3354068.1 phosphatase PAP2 family protein [Zoogloea sp.]